MDDKEMLRKIVDQYARTGCEQVGEIKIRRVQDGKSTYVEPNAEWGRSIVMHQFKVDGKTYWAGYSTRTKTVYVSLAA